MFTPTQEDLELYVLGGFTGDVDALEAHLAADPEARAFVAEQARLELTLREVARAAVFCRACDAIVRDERCDDCGAAVTAGGFEVERVLVHSARGRLYLAHDADRRAVALKELAFVQAPGPDAVAAFEREAGFLRSLEHPAIPRFVASFQERGGVHTRLYLAQEYIAGQALDRRMADHWFDEKEIIDIARQVLGVLAYLQALSPMIVHRDIKPANLIQRADGTIALVDFGAAYDQGQTIGSTTVGTFGYMPIEQMAGVVDATTDPYALGASLLHLLTRREPWKLFESPELGNPNVSPALLAFLRQLTARDPADRFSGAAAALAALDRLGETPPRKRAPRPWRRGLVLGIAIALAAEAGAVVTWLALEDNESQRAVESIDAGAAPVNAATRPDASPPSDVGEARRTSGPAYRPLPLGEAVTVSFVDVPVVEALQVVTAAGNVSLVVPAHVTGRVTMDLKEVPWDRALEAILESTHLVYRYHEDGRILRIHAQADLAALRRQVPEPGTPLPAGKRVDLEFKDIEIQSLIQLLTEVGGVNVIIDSRVRGRLSIHFRDAPWNEALLSVLEASDLIHHYRPAEKLLRISVNTAKRRDAGR